MTDLKVLQLTTVNSTHFNQSIQWNAVTSGNQTISRYIIKYGVSSVVKNYNSTSAHSTTSPMLSTTLTLPLPRSPTTYNVWVAAVGGESVIGEYSEVLKINYTGNVWYTHIRIFRLTDSEDVTCKWLHSLNLFNTSLDIFLFMNGLPYKYAHSSQLYSTHKANEPQCVGHNL